MTAQLYHTARRFVKREDERSAKIFQTGGHAGARPSRKGRNVLRPGPACEAPPPPSPVRLIRNSLRPFQQARRRTGWHGGPENGHPLLAHMGTRREISVRNKILSMSGIVICGNVVASSIIVLEADNRCIPHGRAHVLMRRIPGAWGQPPSQMDNRPPRWNIRLLLASKPKNHPVSPPALKADDFGRVDV